MNKAIVTLTKDEIMVIGNALFNEWSRLKKEESNKVDDCYELLKSFFDIASEMSAQK